MKKERQIWAKFKNEKSEERALVCLYMDLIDMVQVNDYMSAYRFIVVIVADEVRDTDVLVHTLNALSPMKYLIPNWADFVLHARIVISEDCDPETAKNLLKVII